jgi:hypothetical protein
MKKHYETHVEDTDKLISVAGPELDYKSWYEQYRKLMEEQAQRKYGLYTPTSEGDDDFPSIPGMIARYSALGLTNEQMAENPVWVDKTGNGHDLQMKNFIWGGMSGIGGYNQNFNQWGYGNLSTATQTHTSYKIELSVPSTLRTTNIYSNAYSTGKEGDIYDFTLNIVGLKDGASLRITKGIASGVIERIEKDGIYKIYQPIEAGWDQSRIYIFISNPNLIDLNITIEQLPLYPGFIFGDGVDDFAVTEKELNFEDTYTVYTAFIPFKNNPTRNMILCGADSKKTFSMQYSSLVYVSFIAGNNYYINADFVNGLNLFACKRNGNNICIKNLLTNKVVTGTCGDWVENAGLYYLWKNATYASFARAGIAGQIIDNGHFTTDEEDENILNWHKKQYPWLFPDQAWTVTGKTNEDEDRATIANITGNGNDLVLSNFGFAEGSGYGLYAYNFNSFELRDNVVKPTDVKKDSFRIIGIGDNGNVLVLSNTSNSAAWKIRITGMKEGDSCIVGNANRSGDYIKIIKDGIYTFQKQYAATSINGIWYNSSQEVDVLVEQIPEYEGYLVTDGVDDKITSSAFEMGKDFTVVGEWRFIIDERKVAGLIKPPSFYLFNENNGLKLFINNTEKSSSLNTKSLKAICSDGRVYFDDWSEMLLSEEQPITSSSKNLSIGYNSTIYTQMAFKNLGIYNDQLLSKDDCIKAYNYLQTLKAK